MKNATEKAANSVHSGTDAAARMAHDAIDRDAKRAEAAEENIRKSADAAEQRVRRSLVAAKEKSIGAKTAVGQFVHEHPLASLGIAFGVGIMLAALRKRSSGSDGVDPQELH
jgi:ElaB/YqjD/DUF883 family membrane-anchored ribosome-binding protein